MKTLQELKKEIVADEELRKAWSEAIRGGKMMEFIKARGVDATAEELTAFLENEKNGEISDEELDNVAGGGCGREITCSYCGKPVEKSYSLGGMHKDCYYACMNSPYNSHKY